VAACGATILHIRQKVGVNLNSKTIRPYTTLYYSNVKSCMFWLYETAIIRIHVSEI